ncbi:MAG: hypothetical protein ABL930_09140 [Pseudobdellovibrio sp.]
MKKLLIFIGIAATIGLAFASCSGGAGSTSGANVVSGTAGSYQGAGSKWEATFTTTTFVIKKFADVVTSTPDITVNGTYVEYTSGFRKLTVTSATGSGAPAPGVEAYGFEVPGFAFFLKPMGVDEEPIVMLKTGSCPGGTGFAANWIIAKFDNGRTLVDTDDAFGTASFNTTTPATSVATINRLTDVTATPMSANVVNFDYSTCANAVLTFNASVGPPVEVVDMFFTSNGGALVHSHNGTTHDSVIFAAPKHTGDVVQADLAGTYSALVFDDSSPSNKLFPAKLVIPSSGNGTANKIDDVQLDTLTADPAIPIASFTAVSGSNGLFTAAIDPTGDNGRLNCTYFSITSKKVIACNGFGSMGGGREPFFFLARQR